VLGRAEALVCSAAGRQTNAIVPTAALGDTVLAVTRLSGIAEAAYWA
jgi:hypothetical protein